MQSFVIIAAAAIGAAALPAAPAAAQAVERGHAFAPATTQFGLATNVRIHRRHDRRGRFGRRADHAAGDLYLPYREYQGDTLWRSNGFNDWWHDRPDRAFPRWVSNNQNCERQWWSGAGWRC